MSVETVYFPDLEEEMWTVSSSATNYTVGVPTTHTASSLVSNPTSPSFSLYLGPVSNQPRNFSTGQEAKRGSPATTHWLLYAIQGLFYPPETGYSGKLAENPNIVDIEKER